MTSLADRRHGLLHRMANREAVVADATRALYRGVAEVARAWDGLRQHPTDRSYEVALQARVQEMLQPYTRLEALRVPELSYPDPLLTR